MILKDIVSLLANRINQPHVIECYLRKVYAKGYKNGTKDSSWISVNDSLPGMHQRVLVLHKLPKRLNVYIMKRIPHDTSNPNNGKWHWSKVTDDNEVTHWMPIPSFNEILEANRDVLKKKETNNE